MNQFIKIFAPISTWLKGEGRRKKIIYTLALLTLMVVAFYSVYRNTFGIVYEDFNFQSRQRDSEALVLGPIVADQYDLAWKHNYYLGITSIKSNPPTALRWVWWPLRLQSYSLFGRKTISDKRIEILARDFKGDPLKPFFRIRLPRNNTLDAYIGRRIIFDDEKLNATRHIIRFVFHKVHHSFLYLSGEKFSVPEDRRKKIGFVISGNPPKVSDLKISKVYQRQFGIQGILFFKLHKLFSRERLTDLYKVTSVLFILTIFALAFLYSRIFFPSFAWIFLLSIFLSPWMTAIAKNLYWIPFAWFLPAVFAGLYFLSGRRIYLLGVYLAFLFKFLAGYEYISSVILLAAAPFVYQAIMNFAPAHARKAGAWIAPTKGFALICGLAVLGFITALVPHINLHPAGFVTGFQEAYSNALFRAYSNEESSLITVINQYIFGWSEYTITIIPSFILFPILFFASITTIFYRHIVVKIHKFRDLALFITFLLPPLSWFVLAKGHSAGHIQINYLPLYFGFVAAILYISFNGLKFLTLYAQQWAVKQKLEQIE